jgi:MFS family permease
MGKVMGFLSTGMMAAAAVVPVTFGWLLDIGEPSWVFWLSALFVTGGLVTFVTFRPPGARPPSGRTPHKT